MADLSITAANVQHQDGSSLGRGIAAAVITAGDVLYGPDSGLLLSFNSGTAAQAASVGIAANDAAVGQPISYVKTGKVDLGATLSIGKVYCAGAAAGGIAPVDDVLTGDFVTILGVASTTALLIMGLNVSGVQVP